MIYCYYNDDAFFEIATALNEALNKKGYSSQLISRIPLSQQQESNNQRDLYIMLGLNNETPFLPRYYIAYQFEQTGNQHSWFSESYLRKLRGAMEIWDYSLKNIQNMKTYPEIPKVRYVPLGYMPCLTRIKKNIPTSRKKYDILFYGSSCPRRDRIIKELREAGLKKIYYGQYSLWGEERDRLISESKIVLNLHYYPNPILEVSRLTYLLSNNAFVISERSLDPILDREYNDMVVFSDEKDIIEKCQYYLDHPMKMDEFVAQSAKKFRSEAMSYLTKIPNNVLSECLEKIQNNDKTTSTTDNDDWKIVTHHKKSKNESQQLSRRGIIRPKFRMADVEITSDGAAILKNLGNDLTEDNCPFVSLVTPSSSRTWALTTIALRNFYSLIYPQNKMEWIILDSNPTEPVHLPADPRIKYEVIPDSIPLWEKRNMLNERASGEIIIHMDDDDYYLPQSIWAKVKLLHAYRKSNNPPIECVGCSKELGIYHLIDNYSYLANTKYMSEASMAYYRKFWEEQKFRDERLEMGEGYSFIQGRENRVLDMPYYFNFIAVTHGSNYTGLLRTYENSENQNHDNFFNMWDRETQLFFMELRERARKYAQ